MGVLDELGSSAANMITEGGGEKAVLFVYLVDLFDDVDDELDDLEVEELAKIMEEEKKSKIKRKK